MQTGRQPTPIESRIFTAILLTILLLFIAGLCGLVLIGLARLLL
jgi:hypothetical protein